MLIISLPHLIYCRLEDLWLNDNQIESIEGIAEAVTGSREKLTTVYLENNPCVRLFLPLQIQNFFYLETFIHGDWAIYSYFQYNEFHLPFGGSFISFNYHLILLGNFMTMKCE